MGEILGEGSYGCIIKPPLQCADKIVSYEGKISKVLEKDDLNERLMTKEANNITNNAKYIIQEPIVCSPRKEDIPEIKKCNNFKNNKRFNKFKLFLYDDAGQSIYQLTNGSNSDFMVDIDFLREAIVLFDAVSLFVKNEFLHYDIKNQNIMYNKFAPAGERIKIIDFGISTSFSTILQKTCLNQAETSYMFHPPELSYLCRKKFQLYQTNKEDVYKSYETQHRYISRHTFDSIENETLLNEYALNSSILNGGVSLDQVLEKCVVTIDSYGIGIALKRCLNYGRDTIPAEIFAELNQLFNEMYHPDPMLRVDIETARNRYLMIVSPPPQETRKRIRSPSPQKTPISPKKEQRKNCSPGKECYEPINRCYVKCKVRNPSTRRCKKVCAKGGTRRRK